MVAGASGTLLTCRQAVSSDLGMSKGTPLVLCGAKRLHAFLAFQSAHPVNQQKLIAHDAR